MNFPIKSPASCQSLKPASPGATAFYERGYDGETRSSICWAALLALGPVQAAPVTPEAQLARAVAGRVPGAPVDCINLRAVRSTTIIRNTGIIFDAGRTLYVNLPNAGREDLDPFDAIVTNTRNAQLCSVDTVELFNAPARMRTGVIFLGKFIPYRKMQG